MKYGHCSILSVQRTSYGGKSSANKLLDEDKERYFLYVEDVTCLLKYYVTDSIITKAISYIVCLKKITTEISVQLAEAQKSHAVKTLF